MKNRDSRHNKKIRKLIVLCVLCGIILTVSTYAWFIGMKTVDVTSFDIKIATTEGLFLSMDGENWSYNLDAINADAYTGNANQWLKEEGEGLIPMSSVGDMDATASRLKLYEKGSLTATPGGARLLTSRVNNFVDKVTDSTEYKEGKGYVAFDLFIKNLSGNEYYVDNNPKNEEAIYLTANSAVKVASSGKANAGIENSVRVAFAQIGRVKAEDAKSTPDVITGITCSDVETDGVKSVTGICRQAQIWEPNDTAHVTNAINYYDTACLTRKTTGKNVIDSASYDGACKTITNGTAYPTYAISRAINVEDEVNIYDGAEFNSYAANTTDFASYAAADAATKPTYKLVDYPYFTDTMKDVTGTSRQSFMTLAPNSITKVRVYIWLEGQDIDNYDFASLGEAISVNFGFTKEQLSQDDIPGYDGPDTNITPTPDEENGKEDNA